MWGLLTDDDPCVSRNDTPALFQGCIRGVNECILTAHKPNLNTVHEERTCSCEFVCFSKTHTNYVTRATGWGRERGALQRDTTQHCRSAN